MSEIPNYSADDETIFLSKRKYSPDGDTISFRELMGLGEHHLGMAFLGGTYLDCLKVLDRYYASRENAKFCLESGLVAEKSKIDCIRNNLQCKGYSEKEIDSMLKPMEKELSTQSKLQPLSRFVDRPDDQIQARRLENNKWAAASIFLIPKGEPMHRVERIRDAIRTMTRDIAMVDFWSGDPMLDSHYRCPDFSGFREHGYKAVLFSEDCEPNPNYHPQGTSHHRS
jgi:hypothetical protein